MSGLLRLAADDAPQLIDLAGVYELSQQPIDAARWWAPPAVDVCVLAVSEAVYSANTANTRDTDTLIQVGETRQEAIRELARLGATRKQIALAIGGNYNDAYAVVKKRLIVRRSRLRRRRKYQFHLHD